MKCMLVSLIVLLLSTATWAQGDQPDSVPFCVVVKDATCSTNGCPPLDGCESVEFTVPTSGTYNFKCLVHCTSGSCQNCYGRVCLQIVDDGDINSCHAAGGDCTQDCTPNVISQQLQARTNYRLVVCLLPCDNHTCDDCDETCKAVGYVYRPGDICPGY